MKRLLAALVLSAFAAVATAQGTDADANPRVKLTTSLGEIVLELYPDQAPKTVENFLRYVDAGFYEGTIFHRVIQGFMVQGGGMTAGFGRKPTYEPIRNEADNGLANTPGTIAMARTRDPHSASAQFFINVADNQFLNFRDRTAQGWGYTVFGRVVEGMETVKRIESTPTTNKAGQPDVPVDPIIIKEAARVAAAPTD